LLDLNPIENIWKHIKDLISRRRHKIKNVQDIRFVLMAIWLEIDGNFLLKLCNSIPRRWEAHLENKGGAMKY
jgi:transposase